MAPCLSSPSWPGPTPGDIWGRPGIFDFGGLGGPAAQHKNAKKWGASPSTFLNVFGGPPGQPCWAQTRAHCHFVIPNRTCKPKATVTSRSLGRWWWRWWWHCEVVVFFTALVGDRRLTPPPLPSQVPGGVGDTRLLETDILERTNVPHTPRSRGEGGDAGHSSVLQITKNNPYVITQKKQHDRSDAIDLFPRERHASH